MNWSNRNISISLAIDAREKVEHERKSGRNEIALPYSHPGDWRHHRVLAFQQQLPPRARLREKQRATQKSEKGVEREKRQAAFRKEKAKIPEPERRDVSAAGDDGDGADRRKVPQAVPSDSDYQASAAIERRSRRDDSKRCAEPESVSLRYRRRRK